MFACGNCIYDVMWRAFPPTATWCVIVPVWLVVLSILKSAGRARLAGVPPISATVPLVLLTWLMAPSVMGPLLGIWMPVSIATGTLSGWLSTQRVQARHLVKMVTSLAVIALLIGAGWDYLGDQRRSIEARDPHQSRHPESGPAKS